MENTDHKKKQMNKPSLKTLKINPVVNIAEKNEKASPLTRELAMANNTFQNDINVRPVVETPLLSKQDLTPRSDNKQVNFSIEKVVASQISTIQQSPKKFNGTTSPRTLGVVPKNYRQNAKNSYDN